jgi:hypothetical protein
MPKMEHQILQSDAEARNPISPLCVTVRAP